MIIGSFRGDIVLSSHKKFNFSNHFKLKNLSHHRRFIVYFIRLLASFGALCALIPFWSSWKPSDKVKAMSGALQVDLSHLEPGQQMTVEWRGKPIWIIRRTPSMLNELKNTQALRDPNSLEVHQPDYARNSFRSIKPEYSVLVGLCTHLGCVPKLKAHMAANHAQNSTGFYCPCHGSRFDMAGRVYKDVPAAYNLEVPPYHFIQDNIIVIGES
ncbi:MAG: ubiquinol-cytochrome c reductase iron-sulfur subunit [Legionellaceae bacterium]|nr:ubiquinol-cytochrome c reductase iron-sulfur subunit [Legionellaceae bacterium]